MVVSSLIDVEPGAMINALLRACEYELAVIGNDPSKSAAKYAVFVNAVKLAQAHDGKLQMQRVSGEDYGPSPSYLPASDSYDFGDTISVPVIP